MLIPEGGIPVLLLLFGSPCRYNLEDSYTQPFKRAIAVGGAGGVMYACNMVNGVPAVASRDLANRLRSWGFSGYRTTDGDGIGGISDPHRQNYTAGIKEAIEIALTDGESDIDDGPNYANHMVDAIEAGLNVSMVKRALFNTFRMRFRLGLFDPPGQQRWAKLGAADVDAATSRQLNHEVARQGLVLLQNDNSTLPFSVPSSGSVVVIGPSANSTRLLGGGHYARDLSIVDGFETGGFPGIPTAIQALLRAGNPGQSSSGATVRYMPGIKCSPPRRLGVHRPGGRPHAACERRASRESRDPGRACDQPAVAGAMRLDSGNTRGWRAEPLWV